MPCWRSGNTHGFCVTGGHSPIASEPTPSRRLWAAAPGATPALRIEHTTGGRADHSKPELSTLLESGTFYFALTPVRTGSRSYSGSTRPALLPPAPVPPVCKNDGLHSRKPRSVSPRNAAGEWDNF